MIRYGGLAFLFLFWGCATPVAPTGGPVDKTPPALSSITPPNQTVNFDGNTLELTFSEYVDARSFQQAFSMTPDLGEQPEFKWKGRRVRVQFTAPLRPNTTYILTLDNTLKDAHGVSLTQPLTLAFATGAQMNRGHLSGTVRNPQTNTGLAAVDVLAYAVPDSTALDTLNLQQPPAYRTQTDAEGLFTFAYLPEQPFFVMAIQDRNRNRRWDDGESFAVPPAPTLLAQPDSVAQPTAAPWLITVQDTIAPEVQRVRAWSTERLALRFSEPVRLSRTDTLTWAVVDSASGQAVPIHAVYTLLRDPYSIYLHTDSLAAQRHTLRTGAAVDTSGNPLALGFHGVTPATRPDTFQLRFERFLPTQPHQIQDSLWVLRPGTAPGVAFSLPLPQPQPALISALNADGATLPFTLDTENGVHYQLVFTPPLPAGTAFQVLVRDPVAGQDTVYTQYYALLSDEKKGSLIGVVEGAAPAQVELYPQSPPTEAYTTTTDSAGRFTFSDIPDGQYNLRWYTDADGNQQWSGGQLHPFRPAEPVFWYRDSLRVRARWETVMEDSLKANW